MAAVRGAVRPSITCLGHSNVVLNCKFFLKYACMPCYLINASSVHVIVHGWTFEKELEQIIARTPFVMQ